MANLTAHEVAGMQSDIDVMRTEIESLKLSNAMLTSERDHLIVELALTKASRDKEFSKATTMNTIIRQTSVMLIEGIKRMEDQTRTQQEIELGIVDPDNMDPSPAFLARRQHGVITGRTSSETPAITEREKAYEIAQERAQERQTEERNDGPRDLDEPPVAALPPRIGPRVRNDIVDSRLPPVSMMPRDPQTLLMRSVEEIAGLRKGG